MGVDVAEGKIRDAGHDLASILVKQLPDFSAISILNCRSLNQAGAYASLEPPAVFARKVLVLAIAYKALAVIEANGPGLAVIQAMENYRYRHLYTRSVFDRTNKTWTNHKGFKTTSLSRDILIRLFQDAMGDEGGMWIKDGRTLEEMRAFRYNKFGKAEAPSGCKDDLVFASMLALEGRRKHFRPEQIPAAVRYQGHPDREHWEWHQAFIDDKTKERQNSAGGLDLNDEDFDEKDPDFAEEF